MAHKRARIARLSPCQVEPGGIEPPSTTGPHAAFCSVETFRSPHAV